MSEFKDVFLQLRKEYNYTQEEMASKLNVSKATIGMWETGKRLPGPEKYEEIADYFNVDMDYLYGRSYIKRKIVYHSEKEIEDNLLERSKHAELINIFNTFGYDTFKLMYVYTNIPEDSRKGINENFDFLAHKYNMTVPTSDDLDKEIYESIVSRDLSENEINALYEESQSLEAAHGNKESNEEQIKHDNDIMDDDSEWK